VRIVFLAAGILLSGCSREGGRTAERPASPEIVAGVYTTTEFLEPGQNDAGVDVQAGGGFMNLTLRPDHGVEGKLVIPPGLGSNYDGSNMSFLGSWRAKGAGIIVEGSGTLLDGHEILCGTGILETAPGGRGPFRMKFQKMHDLN
jgi:hypothetical protein